MLHLRGQRQVLVIELLTQLMLVYVYKGLLPHRLGFFSLNHVSILANTLFTPFPFV